MLSRGQRCNDGSAQHTCMHGPPTRPCSPIWTSCTAGARTGRLQPAAAARLQDRPPPVRGAAAEWRAAPAAQHSTAGRCRAPSAALAQCGAPPAARARGCRQRYALLRVQEQHCPEVPGAAARNGQRYSSFTVTARHPAHPLPLVCRFIFRAPKRQQRPKERLHDSDARGATSLGRRWPQAVGGRSQPAPYAFVGAPAPQLPPLFALVQAGGVAHGWERTRGWRLAAVRGHWPSSVPRVWWA